MNLGEIKKIRLLQDGDLFREETAWLIAEVERLQDMYQVVGLQSNIQPRGHCLC